jgi:SnoaL-like domain
MADRTNEEVVRAYMDAVVVNDADVMKALRDPDWILDYPQSGERFRGHANERAMADNYPGGLPEVDPGRIVGSEDRWVVTPSFTYERIAGSGDTWWCEGTARYPDGSTWYALTMFRLRGGLILREITYWALPFDPPAWRAQWVEPITLE